MFTFWCFRQQTPGLSMTGHLHAPTFWSFVLGHDNLSPVEQQRHWLEDTVCLELIIHKDGSVSIARSVNSDSIQLFILDAVKLAVIQQSVFNERMWHFKGEVKTFSDPSYIFSGGQDPPTTGSTPVIYRGSWIAHRHLADEIVHCAGSAIYQICFRLPIPNPNPKP